MNAEISFHHPDLIAGKENNNSTLNSKKWNQAAAAAAATAMMSPDLVSVDESIESIVADRQSVDNDERSLGGRDRNCQNKNSLTGIQEDVDGEEPEAEPEVEPEPEREPEPEEPPPGFRLNRSRHNSIVGIVNSFRKEKRRGSDEGFEDKRGRRKSWQARLTHLPRDKFGGKGDRKRKQNAGGEDSCENGERGKMSLSYERSKRKSWWNIFVPDEFSSKSRRASTDVGRAPLSVPYTRSKSRSVDHGISSPFDLDLLRSKVDDRFDCVAGLYLIPQEWMQEQCMCFEAPSAECAQCPGDSDGDLDKEKKKSLPPINSIPYTVQPSDTLNSVAARFDITPSELRKINRLASNLIFPGQLIHVPEKKVFAEGDEQAEETPSSSASVEDGEQHEPPSEEKEILDNLRPVSPKPGHIERVKAPMSPQSKRADPREARFLKINVRHITDGQGVVGGVLLVTPNAVMFDPNVSDPLVIEHGPESYGVIAPMEFVVNAAIYYDIAHMRVGHADNKSDCNKPEIYYAKSHEKGISDKRLSEPQGSPGRDSLLVKDETFPELAPSKGSSDEDNESSSSYAGREGDAFPKAFDRDLVTPTNLTEAVGEKQEDQTTSHVPALISQQSCPEPEMATKPVRSLEERRTSSLDHHWAVPKAKSHSVDAQMEGGDKIGLVGSREQGVEETTSEKVKKEEDGEEGEGSDDKNRLTKLNCYDSGIDVRETSSSGNQQDFPIVVTPLRRVTRDADIIFSSKDECVILASNPDARKKANSVSFSDAKEAAKEEKEDEKLAIEGKKSKMLKRLSYPIAWMENSFVSDSKDLEKDPLSSVPTSSDSQHSSVFSKVFSSSPKNFVSDIGSGIADLGSGIVDIGSGIGSGIVDLGSGIGSGIVDIGSGLSDFGSNLFLMKTPSEDSGGGGARSPAGSNTPVTRSPLASRFPPQPPNTPCPSQTEAHNYGGKKEGVLGRSSVGAFIRHSGSNEDAKGHLSRSFTPKLDYRSMVSVEDMPELFVSFDKLILRPARSCEDPPLYLRLRMGKPIDKKIPKSTPIMSYGKKKMRPEYWFSVPRNRVDELYNFLHIWVPQLYGDLDEMDPKARGYELVESDTELWEDEEAASGEGVGESGDNDELTDLTRESWEVLSMSEELRRALYASSVGSLDLDAYVPELVGTTEILTEEHRKQLCRHLPARAEGYLWTLVFSTSQHGFSLNSLYRKMMRIESPILLVIQDTDNNVFGALTSCSLKVSDHFYGTGESLLFRFNPEFGAYQWTGENMYFIKGNNESLAIGAGDGKFGLWLDGDLNLGRSERCTTYDNPPLSSQEDFVVKTLECWAFV